MMHSESQPVSLRGGWLGGLHCHKCQCKNKESDHPVSGRGKDDLAEIQSDSGVSIGGGSSSASIKATK